MLHTQLDFAMIQHNDPHAVVLWTITRKIIALCGNASACFITYSPSDTFEIYAVYHERL